MRIWKSYKTKLNHQVQCNELNYKLILFSLFWGVSFREKEVGYIYILLRERERELNQRQSTHPITLLKIAACNVIHLHTVPRSHFLRRICFPLCTFQPKQYTTPYKKIKSYNLFICVFNIHTHLIEKCQPIVWSPPNFKCMKGTNSAANT
jgi:hypothetical protein